MAAQPYPTGPSYTWSEVWTRALTQPSVETYEDLLRDPQATPARANAWVFAATLASVVISTILTLIFVGGEDVNAGALIPIMICAGPVAGLLAIVGLWIGVFITQTIASMLGGTGTYSRMAYVYAAIGAPLSIISGILSPIPVLNLLGIPLGLYGLVLYVMGVKANNGFGWGQAIIATLGIFIVVVAIGCGVILLLASLGESIGNIFSNIIDQLGTPSP